MKPLFKSRTFWFNIITAVLAIANGQPAGNFIPADVLAGVVAGLNIVLRLVTKGPVALR